MRVLLIVVSVFLLFNILKAGELTINPLNPKNAMIVTINYTSNGFFQKNEQLNACFYCFSYGEKTIEGIETPLAYNEVNSSFEATYQLPPKSIFILIKVGNGKRFDTNQSEFWQLFIYGNDGKPLKGANLSCAVSYLGMLPQNSSRVVNFDKALEYFQNELSLYPDNIQAQIGYSSLNFDMRKISKNEFDESLKKIIKSGFDENNEGDLRAVVRALRTLDKSDKAQQLERNFIENHLQSDLAEELAMAQLAKADNLAEFSGNVQKYLKLFPNSANRERVFSALVSGYLQDDRYDDIYTLLNSYTDVPSSAYAKLAMAYLENSEKLTEKQLKRNIGKALDILKFAIDESRKLDYQYKPKHLCDSEWKISKMLEYADIMKIYGQVNHLAGNNDDAIKLLKKKKKIFDESTPPDLYLELIETYIESYKDSIAYNLAAEAILESKNSKETDSYHKILFDSLNTSGEYKTVYDSLCIIAKNKRLKELKDEQLNIPVTLGTVTSLLGSEMKFDSLKGKVIVIDLWSTWCGPCKESLPAMDNLYSLYRESTDIIFTSVNVWEKEEGKDRLDNIKKFFGKSDYDLPIFIDNTNVLPYKLGVTGLPTTIYIDKNGIIRFKDAGYVSADFLMNACDKIDFLRNR
ncbi:MAG: TlpA family protein disulfide reductase [Ignavibacteriae bacterium]|nr:TlpA family protein disulfide reductase [Ignavibacteriota bacterium]